MVDAADSKRDQAHKEADAWSEFEALLSRLPADRLTAPDALDGWTVKEMLHHVRGWLAQCREDLERIRDGSYTARDETDGEVNARNAAFAEEASLLEVDAVRAGLEAERERVLRAWSELPNVDEVAIERFACETHEHYEEHLPDLERAAH